MPETQLDFSDLSLALAGAKVGVWKWHTADDDLVWSPEVFEIFRVDPKKIKGKLGFGHYSRIIHEEDLARVVATINGAIEACGDFRIEHRLRFGEEIRWVRGLGRALLDEQGRAVGLTGAVMDISSERKQMDEIASAGEKFRLYSELASDYIYSADLTSDVLVPTIVGGSFERTTGYKVDEIETYGGWIGLMHPEDRGAVESIMGELAKGHPVVHEYRLRTKDGAYRWLRDRIHPVLSPAGGLIGLNGGVQDITERRSLLDQLGHAQKMEALAHLAGSVAHDFNNLLTVMFGASGLVRLELSGDVAIEALDALDSAAERAADLSSSLLTFSRRQVAIRRPRRLVEVIEGAMPILERSTGEKVSIALVDESEGVVVAVDSSQMELALLNLVVNARDAMPEGGVITIRVGREIWVDRDPRRPAELDPGAYASVAVADSGTGITNEAMARLFEPFFTTKEAGSGTGLGLAAVHGVARQHDGAVEVSSEPGQGATFALYVPASDEEADTGTSRGPWRSTVGGTEKVLVVEDDPLVRSVTVRSLTELGYQVVFVEKAEDAMGLVENVDLVLSDIRLPGMSGTELALRVAERWPETPVILMSGLVEDDEQKAVVESERFLFMHKPFTQAGLARRLRQAFGDD